MFEKGLATRRLLSLFVVVVLVAVAFAGVNLVFDDASPVQEAEAVQRNHLVINALLYNAVTTESNNEWIEIMNTHTATISLNDYMVGDEETKGGGEGMYEFPDGYELTPGQKCIVALKSDAGAGQGFYQLYGKYPDFEITNTDGTPDMVKVSTWSTGSLGLSNTADEVLLIRQSDEQVMDWVSYRTGATGTDIDGAMNSPDSSSAADNVAIERTIDGEDTNDCDVDFGDVAGGGTPQTMAETGSDTTPPTLASASCLAVRTINAVFDEQVNGTDANNTGNWAITSGPNTPNILTASLQFDKMQCELTVDADLLPGTYTIHAYNIKDLKDNNQVDTLVSFPGWDPHLVINEICYNGYYPEPRSEWVEIYNPSSSAINVAQYTISDGEGTWTIPSGTYNVPSGGHFVIANDGSNFFDTYGFYPDFERQGQTQAYDMSYVGDFYLTNTGDEVILNNSVGQTLDVVVWKTPSTLYPGISPATVSEGDGETIQRDPEGLEGTEAAGGPPTGHDEGTEDQTSVFNVGTPTPETLDMNAPTISNVRHVWDSTHFTVWWNTVDASWPEINDVADSAVVWSVGTDPDSTTNYTESEPFLVTNHTISVWGLTPGSTIYYYVMSTDGLGHIAVDKNGSAYYSFTLDGTDTAAPTLGSGPTANPVTDTTATISWTTNENASTVIFYGIGALEFGSSDLTLVQDHQLTLAGLTPGQTYDYEIRSEDDSGNWLISGGYQFATSAAVARNQYYGNMHAHTSDSDGTGTPAQAFNYYKNTAAAIDFGGLTDHSHYSWSITTQNTTSQSYTDGNFLAIVGQELGSLGAGGYGHMNIFFIDPQAIAGDTQRYDVYEAYDWIAARGGLAGFNHPGYLTNFDDWAYTATGDSVMQTIELMNGKRAGTYEDYYIDILNKGWHVGAEANQDNHEADWGEKQSSGGVTYTTGAWMESLTLDNMADAIEAHQTYAVATNYTAENITDRARLLDFSINGMPMGSDFTTTQDLKVEIHLNFSSGRWFDDMWLIQDGNTIRSEYDIDSGDFVWSSTITNPDPGQHYYYFKWDCDGVQGGSDFGFSSPIWVFVPPAIMPDEYPDFGYVEYTPSSPIGGQAVTVSVPISDDDGIAFAWCYYRINGVGSWTRAAMTDMGGGIYNATIPGQVDGSGVQFYCVAVDTSGQSVSTPTSAPVSTYSYYVGVRPLINEVFANPAASPENPEFIELYNPTGSAIPVDGWTVQDEAADWFDDEWMFPGGASVPANDYLVVGKSANEFSLRFGTFPDYEMNNSRVLTPDMISVNGATPIAINNDEDAIYLWKYINGVKFLVDGCEYGWHGVSVPGDPLLDEPSSQGDSVSRDPLHSDTDNCADDFFIINPATPGQNAPPVFRNVVQNPDAPGNMDPVTVSCDILSDGMTGTPSLWYSINGAAFVQVVMNFLGGVSWDANIPGQAAGFSVEYYMEAQDGSARWGYSPGNYPMSNYSYSVWPHVVISEIYWNCTVWIDEVQHAAYVEVFNPTNTTIDLNGWELEGEPTWYTKKWLFPADPLSVLGPFETRTIAKTAGGGAVLGFIDEFGFAPDFEMYDSDMTNEPYVDDDNLAVLNMDLKAPGSAYDDQLELYGANYYDAIYLKNAGGVIIDAVEYGVQGEYAPGDPYPEIPVGTSMHRNVLDVDTNDCLTDFFTATTPTPGEQMAQYDVVTGWNALGYPVSFSMSVGQLLQEIDGNYEAVSYYDAWMWYHNVTAKTFSPNSDFATVTHQTPTMVKMTSDDSFAVAGEVQQSYTVNFMVGWNHFTYNKIYEAPVLDEIYLRYLGTVEVVEYFDPVTQGYVAVVPGVDNLIPGRTYAIKVADAGSLTFWNDVA